MHVPLTEVILSHDGTELARATLPPGEYIIGREPGVDLHADTPLLSRKHARLTINYDHLLLEDLASSNGTFVNDRPLAEPTRLFPNQSVRLGPDITLEVRRQRAPSEPGVSLAPAQAAIARHLPAELLAEKRYAIGGVIAQGGMGAILDVRQCAIDRTVAMKVMLATGDEADVLRFIDEAKITGQLDHPNIVPIHELGVDEQGQLFYTMKMVRGVTLKKVLADLAAGDAATEKKYPLPVLLTVFQKVCDALAFAHAKGVIHRDLKPENLMLGDFGSVLVMDWGLAKVVGKTEDERRKAEEDGRPASVILTARSVPESSDFRPPTSAFLTMAGSIMGTPAYMSPEQARGEIETLDARSDIYALGAILFEILAMRPAYTGTDAMEIVGKVARGEIEPLECGDSSPLWWKRSDAAGTPEPRAPARPGAPRPPKAAMNRRTPQSLLAVVRQAMAFEAAARYPRVEDLQADLLAYQTGFATSAEKAGAWRQIALLVRRHKATALGLAAVLLVGSVLGTGAVVQGRRARAALASLRAAAPTLAAQAQTLLGEQKLDDAIAKLNFALTIDPTNPDYLLRRANYLQAAARLDEAIPAYRQRLALRDDPAVRENLALCEKLVSRATDPAALRELYDALNKQGRNLEAAPLAVKLGFGSAATEALIKEVLRPLEKFSEWKINPRRVYCERGGEFKLELDRLPITDIEFLRKLRGHPISSVSIGSTLVRNLSPLAELPITKFFADRFPGTDLSPLAGKRFTDIDFDNTEISSLEVFRESPIRYLRLANCRKISDFSPLAGMPLESAALSGTKITSLEILRGAPLRELWIGGTRVTTLAGLEESPLEILNADHCNALENIDVIRQLPLREVSINGCPLRDLTPLLDLPKLEKLRVSKLGKLLAPLRHHPSLKFIAYDDEPYRPAAEFWAAYDAQQAVEKK